VLIAQAVFPLRARTNRPTDATERPTQAGGCTAGVANDRTQQSAGTAFRQVSVGDKTRPVASVGWVSTPGLQEPRSNYSSHMFSSGVPAQPGINPEKKARQEKAECIIVCVHINNTHTKARISYQLLQHSTNNKY